MVVHENFNSEIKKYRKKQENVHNNVNIEISQIPIINQTKLQFQTKFEY